MKRVKTTHVIEISFFCYSKKVPPLGEFAYLFTLKLNKCGIFCRLFSRYVCLRYVLSYTRESKYLAGDAAFNICFNIQITVYISILNSFAYVDIIRKLFEYWISYQKSFAIFILAAQLGDWTFQIENLSVPKF